MSSEWRSTQRVIWWEKRVGMRLERGVKGTLVERVIADVFRVEVHPTRYLVGEEAGERGC